MRRVPLAFVLLGVMSLLAAGALTLGILQSPTGATTFVHNDALATLSAPSVAGQVSEGSRSGGTQVTALFTYTAAARRGTETARSGSVGPRTRTFTGARAVQLVSPITEILTLSGFSGRGATFVLTATVASIVPARERPLVRGTFSEVVTASGGYVVAVVETYHVIELGHRVDARIDYRLRRIGGREAP